MKVNRSLPIIGVLLVANAVWAQKVETQYNHSANFSSYKTYAWRQERLLTQQSRENQAAIKKSLYNAVNTQLQAKGFTQTQSSPDFYVGYSGGALAKGMAAEGMTPVELAHPLTADSLAVSTMPSEIPNVWVTMQGTLQFDVIDAKSNTVVWTSTLREKISHPGEMPKDLDRVTAELAEKAFQRFPPKTRR